LGIPEALGLPVLSVYRLTANGVATVRNRGLGSFEVYEDVSPQFLRHLVDANDVFLTLAERVAWDELPFAWLGSHRSRLSFVQIIVDPRGGPSRQCQRMLAPDALVTPRGDPKAARCFLELDRATEAVGAGYGHNSIERKLRAYRALIVQLIPGKSCTAYDAVFRRSPRPARVVFVVATTDRHMRRVASIVKKAREITPELDVRAMAASDTEAIRAAMLPPGAAAAQPRSTPPKWGVTTLNQVVELRNAFVEAAPDLKTASQARPDCHGRLRRLALACKSLVERAKESLGDRSDVLPTVPATSKEGA
jgi:hypothetical protein